MRDNLFKIKARVFASVFTFADLDNGATFVFAEEDDAGKFQNPDTPQALWLKLQAHRAQRLGGNRRVEVRPSQPVCEAALVIEPVLRLEHAGYSLPPELR